MSETPGCELSTREQSQVEWQALTAELLEVQRETSCLDKEVAPHMAKSHGVLQVWESTGVFVCDPPYALDQVLFIIQESLVLYGEDTLLSMPELILEQLEECLLNAQKDGVDQRYTSLVNAEQKLNEKAVHLEATKSMLHKQTEASASEVFSVFKAMGKQNIAQLQAISRSIKKEGSYSEGTKIIPVRENIRSEVMQKIDSIIATLTIIKSHFKPGERYLMDTAQINLGGESQVEIFAGVFDAISFGIRDEDRKKELKQKVAAELGIKLSGRAKNASVLKSQLYLREQSANLVPGNTLEDISFDRASPIMLRESPKIIIYPNPSLESDYLCEAHVGNADPILLPFNRDVSNEGLHAAINQHTIRSVYSNNGGHGVLAAMLGTGAALSGTVSETIETTAIGNDQMMETLLYMELGQNFALHTRFLNQQELDEIADNTRFKVPGGDFGAFNSINPFDQSKLMSGLGFDKTSIGQQNMRWAGSLYRGSKRVEKSYESLYRMMHADDVKAGCPILKAALGAELFDRLEF